MKHIKDQQAGTVTGLENGIGKEGDSYEKKADAIGERVNQGKSAEDLMSS